MISVFFNNAIIVPITNVLDVFFHFFTKATNQNYAILGLSFVVMLASLPLYIVAEKWQSVERNVQAKMSEGVSLIKEVFCGDERYMMLQTFYREHHYHPLFALRSSFSLLIQIPFFIAAYQYISNLPSLAGSRFLFIRDMANPDAFFSIGNFHVNVLPIAMTLINIIAGSISTKGFAIKEKLPVYLSALVFLVLLYNSPAALVVYWTMNNVLSLVKNIFYKMKKPLVVLYVLDIFLGK